MPHIKDLEKLYREQKAKHHMRKIFKDKKNSKNVRRIDKILAAYEIQLEEQLVPAILHYIEANLIPDCRGKFIEKIPATERKQKREQHSREHKQKIAQLNLYLERILEVAQQRQDSWQRLQQAIEAEGARIESELRQYPADDPLKKSIVDILSQIKKISPNDIHIKHQQALKSVGTILSTASDWKNEFLSKLQKEIVAAGLKYRKENNDKPLPESVIDKMVLDSIKKHKSEAISVLNSFMQAPLKSFELSVLAALARDGKVLEKEVLVKLTRPGMVVPLFNQKIDLKTIRELFKGLDAKSIQDLIRKEQAKEIVKSSDLSRASEKRTRASSWYAGQDPKSGQPMHERSKTKKPSDDHPKSHRRSL